MGRTRPLGKVSFRARRAVFFLIIASLLGASPSRAERIEDLASGTPAHMGRELPEASYVSFETAKLRKARVLWVNFAYLAEQGIEFPAAGLTPEFEQQLLDAFAYMVPPEGESGVAEDFDLHRTKTYYADRYGGHGMGMNFGSGRAGAAGRFQIKGIGRTPLVSPSQPFDHGHGGASLEESIREAIWGEINHHELPHGSNRVIAVIDAGTYTEWKDGGRERRALIVREDPLRPAHSLRNAYESADEFKRRMKNFRFERFLPASLEEGTKESISSRLKNFANKIGEQYAAAFAKKFFHGAPSPSNIEIDGKFLDFGTMTAQDAFRPIQVLDFAAAAGRGTLDELGRWTLSPLLASHRDYGWAAKKSPAWSIDARELTAIEKSFYDSYDRRLKQEWARLTGAPPTFAADYVSSPRGEKLAAAIRKIAEHDRKAVNVDQAVPLKNDEYHLPTILEIAGKKRASRQTPGELDALLHGAIPDPAIRSEFVSEYLAFMAAARDHALRDGVGVDAFEKLVSLRSLNLNRPMPDLYRASLRSQIVGLIDRYQKSGDRSSIWDFIDSRVKVGKTTQRDLGEYEVVLSREEVFLDKRSKLLVYDAKTNQERNAWAYYDPCYSVLSRAP